MTSGSIASYVDNVNAFLRFPNIDRKTEVRNALKVNRQVAKLERKVIQQKRALDNMATPSNSRSKPVGSRSRRKND